MKKLRILSVLFACVMIVTLALTGCGGTTSSGKKDDNGKITLTVTVNATELGDPELYDKYMDEHPNINIEVTPMANNDSKLMSMIASGNPPDIIRCMGYDELPVFIQRGILMPLDEYIEESESINLDNMYEVANLCRYDGEERGTGSLYALPKDWSPIGIWINKDVFAAKGIPLPSDTEPMTWDEFASLAQQLVTKDGEAVECHGCTTSLPLPTLLEMYLNSYGESMWTENYDSTTLGQKSTKDAMKYFMDLQKTAALASSLYPIADTIGSSALLEDEVGMVLGGYWFNGAYAAANKEDKAEGKLMFIPAPVGTKQASYCLDLTCIGIFSQTKHPEEAFELWSYLVAHEDAVTARAKVGLGVPASKDYFDVLPKTSELQAQSLGVVTNYQMNTLDLSPRICPYISYSSLTALFDKYYLPVLFEREDFDKALETINKETEILIKEGKELVGAE